MRKLSRVTSPGLRSVHPENAEGDGHEFRALALQGFLVSYSLIKFIWGAHETMESPPPSSSTWES